jgi:hypothetical protein
MSGKRILLEPMARGVKGTKYSRTYVNSPGKIAGNVLDDVLRGRKSAGLNVKTIRKSAPAYGSEASGWSRPTTALSPSGCPRCLRQGWLHCRPLVLPSPSRQCQPSTSR